MNAEMTLAQMLGSLPTTKIEKIAAELSSLSVAELDALASADGESFIDSAAKEILFHEKFSMADEWGRELAQHDFEKQANLLGTIAGGIGKAVGHVGQVAGKARQAISGATGSMGASLRQGVQNIGQSFQRGMAAPAKAARREAAQAAGMRAAKRVPGDIAAARIQRNLAKAQARGVAPAKASIGRQPMAGPKGPLPGAPPPGGAQVPAAAGGPGLTQRARELAGQVGQWAKANPYAAAGGAAALGLGAGALGASVMNRPKVVTSSVRRLEAALEKLSSRG